jgi:hypothetical protein
LEGLVVAGIVDPGPWHRHSTGITDPGYNRIHIPVVSDNFLWLWRAAVWSDLITSPRPFPLTDRTFPQSPFGDPNHPQANSEAAH